MDEEGRLIGRAWNPDNWRSLESNSEPLGESVSMWAEKHELKVFFRRFECRTAKTEKNWCDLCTCQVSRPSALVEFRGHVISQE